MARANLRVVVNPTNPRADAPHRLRRFLRWHAAQLAMLPPIPDEPGFVFVARTLAWSGDNGARQPVMRALERNFAHALFAELAAFDVALGFDKPRPSDQTL